MVLGDKQHIFHVYIILISFSLIYIIKVVHIFYKLFNCIKE